MTFLDPKLSVLANLTKFSPRPDEAFHPFANGAPERLIKLPQLTQLGRWPTAEAFPKAGSSRIFLKQKKASKP